MPTTLATFRTRVQGNTGNRIKAEDVALQDNALNTAQKLIARAWDFDELKVFKDSTLILNPEALGNWEPVDGSTYKVQVSGKVAVFGVTSDWARRIWFGSSSTATYQWWQTENYLYSFILGGGSAPSPNNEIYMINHTYHIINDFGLIRPKQIYSIKFRDLDDESSSRKLVYTSKNKFDVEHPHPEDDSRRHPEVYTRFGNLVQIYPVIDDHTFLDRSANVDPPCLSIQYSKWPAILTDVGDETEYLYIDDLIEQLATGLYWMAIEELENAMIWLKLAEVSAKAVMGDENMGPDRLWSGTGFSSLAKTVKGDYWANPFIRKSP